MILGLLDRVAGALDGSRVVPLMWMLGFSRRYLTSRRANLPVTPAMVTVSLESDMVNVEYNYERGEVMEDSDRSDEEKRGEHLPLYIVLPLV